MNDTGDIQYLTHEQINKEKWDRCIRQADNGLIYSFSFYLDHMASNWEGLVLGDYKAVMPLTWKEKFGIRYLYQPFLTAQLGVFGQQIEAPTVELFINAIPRRFKYIDIYLNHRNVFPVSGFNIYLRTNFVLDLDKPYDVLQKQYRENIRRNVKKAQQSGCTIQKEFGVEKVMELALQQMRERTREIDENAERFRKLYAHLHSLKMATTYGVFDTKNELLSSCVFFYSHNRAYYILVGNHPNGKTLGTSHALIDAFIQDHAGQSLLLDFEGSDVQNLAFFYSSFGAVEEKYAGLKVNRLPFYLRWLKK